MLTVRIVEGKGLEDLINLIEPVYSVHSITRLTETEGRTVPKVSRVVVTTDSWTASTAERKNRYRKKRINEKTVLFIISYKCPQLYKYYG